MSYRITIVAETPEELDKKVRAYIGSNKVFVAQTEDENDDEMEEVKSPYTATPPTNTEIVTPATVVENDVPGALDTEGLPWDKRIHASSKAFNKDGTWRTRRNLDETIHNAVRAELLAKRGGQVSPKVVAESNFQAPVQQPVATTPVAQVPTAPALPTMNSGHTLETFKSNFPVIVANLITEQKLTHDYVNQLKGHFGVAEVWQMTDEHKGILFTDWVKHGLIQQVG